jgi:hypothetical protein
MPDEVLERTRGDLHAVAELVLAGAQYRAAGRIILRVSPGGFRTAVPPELRVDGTDLIVAGRRLPISGSTARALAEAAGVAAGAPAGVYGEGSGRGVDEELLIDPVAARQLCDAFERGDAALRRLAPAEEPTLWPEHFDVAIRVDGINYGISPGDSYLGEPYAYVGVDPVPEGPFWNAPFGAARAMAGLSGIAEVHGFLADGRARFIEAGRGLG